MNTPKNKNLQRLSFQKKACKENEALQQEILDEFAGFFEERTWKQYRAYFENIKVDVSKEDILNATSNQQWLNDIEQAVTHTLERATAEMLKEVLKLKKWDCSFERGTILKDCILLEDIECLRTQSGGGKNG